MQTISDPFNIRCIRSKPERPLQRFTNDRFPNMSIHYQVPYYFVTLAFAAIHLIGWNFTFPTRAEAYLWRTSSLVVLVTIFVFLVLGMIANRSRFGSWTDDKAIPYPDEAAEQAHKQAKPLPCGKSLLHHHW